MKKNLYKSLLLLGMLAVAHLRAMEAPAAQANEFKLIGPNGQEFMVPFSFAHESGTIKELMEAQTSTEAATKEINFTTIEPYILEYVAAIAKAADKHKNLADKALLDAIAVEVNLAQVPLLNILNAFNFLDYTIGKDLIARAIAGDTKSLQELMALQGFDNLKTLVAHYYFLLKGTDLPGIDPDSYGFSIQDYLDYQPSFIYARIKNALANLSELRINNLYGLMHLPNRNQLRVLYLSRNQIHEIPAQIWQKFNQLKELYLLRNQVRKIPANAWQGLNQLEVLNLAENQIREISTQGWQGLNKLQSLDLSNNQIKEIPVRVWQGLNQLQSLSLSNNQIREIPANAWEGLSQLQGLRLRGNQIRVIPAHAWHGLNQLQSLSLSDNQIREIPAHAWQGLNQLRSLFIFGNQIQKIPVHAWQGLNQLQTLDLSKNQIEEIPAHAWQGLNQLHMLDLSENKIHEIFANAWQGLTQLQSLELFENQISDVDKEAVREILPSVLISF